MCHQVSDFWTLCSSVLRQRGILSVISEALNSDTAKSLAEELRQYTDQHSCSVDIMFIPQTTAAYLHIGKGTGPFYATGHYPILAGYDQSGNALFVAQCAPRRPDRFPYYSNVADGASYASVKNGAGEIKDITDFNVLVLRYDPCDLRAHICTTKGAPMDPTGPLAWRKYWPEMDPGIPELAGEQMRFKLEFLDATFSNLTPVVADT